MSDSENSANQQSHSDLTPYAKDDKWVNPNCTHYQRGCDIVSPCCGTKYPCRICHDDVETHLIDRHKIKEVICRKCHQTQPVSKVCANQDCRFNFANYFCSICNLFDYEDKQQFHCEGCKICRVGGAENFFHCQKCDACLSVSMKDNHKCIENRLKSNCPICMEVLDQSLSGLYLPRNCGHFLHAQCVKSMLASGLYTCPTCSKSLVDMKQTWQALDAEVSQVPMPFELRTLARDLLCNDCNEQSLKVQFHAIGMKCTKCGSFNTREI